MNHISAVNKFDALERFCAAMQNIKSYREEIASGEKWILMYPEDTEATLDDGFWTDRLASALGSAHIALAQMPDEWRVLMMPELEGVAP